MTDLFVVGTTRIPADLAAPDDELLNTEAFVYVEGKQLWVRLSLLDSQNNVRAAALMQGYTWTYLRDHVNDLLENGEKLL